MGNSNSLWEYLSREAELPDEVFPGQSLIEIVGDRRLLIENHRGVQAYGVNMICVKATCGLIRICGRGLQLRCMTRRQLVISGCIESVTLLGKERP